jgi:hypothetical protein
MAVRMPDRDLREALDPAVASLQVSSGQARDQPADGRAAAAQVAGCVGLAHRPSCLGVLRVEGVHDLAVDLNRLTRNDLAYPSREVLIRVRDVIHDDAYRPGVTIERR